MCGLYGVNLGGRRWDCTDRVREADLHLGQATPLDFASRTVFDERGGPGCGVAWASKGRPFWSGRIKVCTSGEGPGQDKTRIVIFPAWVSASDTPSTPDHERSMTRAVLQHCM